MKYSVMAAPIIEIGVPQDTKTVLLCGVLEYFISIGCNTPGYQKLRSRPVVLCLPNSTSEWGLDLDGEVLIAERHTEMMRVVDYRVLRTNDARKEFRILLSDPECFPKLLAHMQQHSKFLRGGTNHPIKIVKAI